MAAYSTYTDQELLSLLKEEDHIAFNEVHHRYYTELIRYAYHIVDDKEVCSDLVQDVLVWFWEHRQQHQMRSIKGYLIMAVKYQVANYIRKGKVRANYVLSAASVETHTLNEESLELKELKVVIDTLIQQLPDKCGEIFRLSREEQLSNKEIAVKLGISEVTVAVQIKRALDKLRGSLGKMYFWISFFI
ncbi:RNA polymerase sigma-70 factor (family 1) [Pedobacter africanus]|uniref:RNA polymerase sigma-70 factor (ECF subfamily) n=1 Tax=Pedobacter africanus TaxID=151894 RepID=A0ACC6KWG8_9SPHI|nr:RNA polymerase sigma-70 factor [Pedobacter africanus]MDR6783421.1 RNA polymerase sigma-70 factor (ECF subfamily) [Pedobacter africanus]